MLRFKRLFPTEHKFPALSQSAVSRDLKVLPYSEIVLSRTYQLLEFRLSKSLLSGISLMPPLKLCEHFLVLFDKVFCQNHLLFQRN